MALGELSCITGRGDVPTLDVEPERSESGLDPTLAPVLCDVGEGLASDLSFHTNAWEQHDDLQRGSEDQGRHGW